jgi:acyl carrier protein
MCGVGVSVQLVHCSDVSKLLQDLAEVSQPRFCELADQAEHGRTMAGPENAITAARSALTQSILAFAPTQRRAHVESAVLRVVYELTGAADAALTAETPLMEAGVDSLAATELSSRLRSLTGVALSPTIVFEEPTPRAIATHLITQAVGGAATTVSLSHVGGRCHAGCCCSSGRAMAWWMHRRGGT